MSVNIIQQRLGSYDCKDALEEDHALREIVQELLLAGLSRTDFFKTAAFQGGTALRIFFGLQRFSEDLDFVLKGPDLDMDLIPFLKSACREIEAFGFHFEIIDKKNTTTTVRKAFIKQDAAGIFLDLKYMPKDRSAKSLRVKVECDVNPPSGAGYQIKYLDFPFPCAVLLHDTPSLFAGKIHALLCREYVKGRDWYDLLWYLAQKTPVNVDLLSSALDQVGPWKGLGVKVDLAWLGHALIEKIASMDWQAVQKDVEPFLRPQERPSLAIWGKEFFMDRIKDLGVIPRP
jgi:hypothetical protein